MRSSKTKVQVMAALLALSGGVVAEHVPLKRCEVDARQPGFESCREGTVLAKEEGHGGFCHCLVDRPLPADEFGGLAAYTPAWGEFIVARTGGACPGAADFIDSHIVDGETERLFFHKRIEVSARQQPSGCWGMAVSYRQPTWMEPRWAKRSRWSGPR